MNKCTNSYQIDEFDLLVHISGTPNAEIASHLDTCKFCASNSFSLSYTLQEVLTIAKILERFDQNIKRILLILNTTQNLVKAQKSQNIANYAQEIYRAIVVMLHASFEDMFREIIRTKLTNAKEHVLETIPFPTDTSGRPVMKISLGKLSRFRGLTIDEVVKKAVDQQLNKTSFNSSKEIASWLTRIGVEPVIVREHFPELDSMIERRHQIVHRADIVEINENLAPTPLVLLELAIWLLNISQIVHKFIHSNALVPTTDFYDKWGDNCLKIHAFNKLYRVESQIAGSLNQATDILLRVPSNMLQQHSSMSNQDITWLNELFGQKLNFDNEEE